jgi:hypothetical protein
MDEFLCVFHRDQQECTKASLSCIIKLEQLRTKTGMLTNRKILIMMMNFKLNINSHFKFPLSHEM